MKREIMLTSLLLLLTATLALYVSAQSQTEAQRGMGNGTVIGSGTGIYVVGHGVGVKTKPPVTLCTGPLIVNGENGPAPQYQPLPFPYGSGRADMSNGYPMANTGWAGELKTLRIEYKNGSVSQIDLSEVKKMTVE
jgi:hypothetical protein